jgi:hypothetical protein
MPLQPTLALTRFNTKTWDERERWIDQHNWIGAIYGTPVRATSWIQGTMIVLEMHNNENKVKALGLVKAQAWPTDRVHQIYGDRNYNRYIYKSNYRLILDQIELLPIEKKIIAIFDQLLFKGACHLKRGHGINAVPKWIMQNKQVDFLAYFKAIFVRHYKQVAEQALAVAREAEAVDASAAADEVLTLH